MSSQRIFVIIGVLILLVLIAILTMLVLPTLPPPSTEDLANTQLVQTFTAHAPTLNAITTGTSP